MIYVPFMLHPIVKVEKRSKVAPVIADVTTMEHAIQEEARMLKTVPTIVLAEMVNVTQNAVKHIRRAPLIVPVVMANVKPTAMKIRRHVPKIALRLPS